MIEATCILSILGYVWKIKESKRKDNILIIIIDILELILSNVRFRSIEFISCNTG